MNKSLQRRSVIIYKILREKIQHFSTLSNKKWLNVETAIRIALFTPFRI